MLAGAMKAWMERKPEEELLIEEVGVIAGGGPGRNKGQICHSDVSAPEEFALGALTRAPLPRVFKEDERGIRAAMLAGTRQALGVGEHTGLSPAYPQGHEECRYFGARLLCQDSKTLLAGIKRPFQTNNPAAMWRDYDAFADPGDVSIIPGGTPHHGPPSADPILRVFFVCRRYGTASPYQGYSQVLVGETELFYACLSPEKEELLGNWKKQMDAFASIYEFHQTIVENSPLAKVLAPVANHLKWLGEQGDKSVRSRAAGAVKVLKQAMLTVSTGTAPYGKLKWKKWGDDESEAGRAMQEDWQALLKMAGAAR